MKLLSLTQVADQLAVSRRTAESLVSSGRLPYVDVSVRAGCFGDRTHKRVSQKALDLFIRTNTRTAPPVQPKPRRSTLLSKTALRLL